MQDTAELGALRRAAFDAGSRGRWREARALLDRLLEASPEDATAHAHLGVVLRGLGRTREAVASHERALELAPGLDDVRYNLGNALLELGRPDEALARYDEVLRARPDHRSAQSNRCLALQRLGRVAEAVAGYEAMLAVAPRSASLLAALGHALAAAGRHDEALAGFERALAADLDEVDALLGKARMLAVLRRPDEALGAFERVLASRPDCADVWCGLGNALQDLHRLEAAAARYSRALELDPEHVESLLGRANARAGLGAFDAAIPDYERFLALRPAQPFVAGQLIHTRMRACDWRGFDAARRRLAEGLARGEPLAAPLAVMGVLDDPALQRRAAEAFAQARHPPDDSLGPIVPRPPGGRIRLGYFSADFHDHPVAHLCAGLLEHHDRTAFEVVAFSFGPPVDDAMRRRIVAAVDRFVDVRARSDREVARMAREMGIDVAIDLGGFTLNSRTGIFARRAAPVQVSYLGFVGTMGAPYIDYLIADRVLVPDDASRAHYREQVARLPSYQASDARRPPASREFTRRELGLPEDGVVFCCFSNLYKFVPEVFAQWMRILGRVPGSVLFLYADRPASAARLREQAVAHGIEPARLVFGERLPVPDYLARYRCADLFLDTSPYNAGTTASDALWAGLPVLTRAGRSFCSRMAASVLTTIGLPELIATDADDYEERAVALALDPARRAALRSRLDEARTGSPLFDPARLARSLERACAAMHARAIAGLPPAAIDVGPDADPEPATVAAAGAGALEAANRGDWPQATRRLESAVRRWPGDARLQSNLGVALRRIGRVREAVDAQRAAIALDPGFADAHYNLGNALAELGQADRAIEHYDEALRLRPAHLSTAINRGLALQALGRREAAVAAFEAATRIGPESAAAHYDLGNALSDLGRYAEAERAYGRAARLDPRHAASRNNRGNALVRLGRPAEALASYEAALAIDPDYADAWVNRALALIDLGRAQDALDSADRVLAESPGHAHALCARGNALHAMRRVEDAVREFDRSIAADPDFAQPRLNRALSLLGLGRLREAWPDYEWRWRTPEVEPLRRDLPRPQWTGTQPLEGRTVLLHAEQGLGDTLQFCRYVPWVAARAARVILEVPPRLVAVMGTLPGGAQVVARGDPLPDFDLHCPLLSLPGAFGTELATIPAPRGYLRTDPERLARWSRRLGPRTMPRVGLMWRGGTGSRIRGRSLPLRAFAAALVPGVQYVSLQRELPEEDLRTLADLPGILHCGDEQRDFADAAALCASVDLVVSVDTSVAHLAGALDVPLWVLLPRRCDWRWFDDREDSPWYPGARLLRQTRDGDWSDVLRRVAEGLRRLAGPR